jgi:hypothetical protein
MALRGCLKSDEMCRLARKDLAARHNRNGVSPLGYPFRMERRVEVVSVQTLRAELLWVVAGVGREDQGLQAWAPRACLAQQPKSISATRFSTFKTASKIRRVQEEMDLALGTSAQRRGYILSD